MSKAKVKIEVGILLRGQFRRYLDNCLYKEYIDKWKESKGLLESDFYLYGEDKYLLMIKEDLKNKLGDDWEE